MKKLKVDIYNTNKKYNIIYADPPWKYEDERQHYKIKGIAAKHYNTMPIEDIKALGDVIQNISADDSILFLWTTFPKLKEAIEIITSWGFTYKTLGFSWIKTNPKDGKPFFGIGYYTRSNCEVCLLATKGKARKLVISNKESSCIISEIQEHSKKPDETRHRINQLVGQVPKIELFARQEVDGWDSWGNEI